MKEKTAFQKAAIIQQLQVLADKIQKYGVTIFVCIVALTYGLIFFQITSLHAAQPSSSQIDKYVRASHAPKLDQKAIKQLESLKDNSVNVQALFDRNRDNPFQ